ncbi:hypothetical protein [Kribbella sp. NPDC051718]|uniref:hypothetical protein n=1 Tax=Kribbella sp. NPDC051718 TaxID=3155168 RepID=UPI0034467D5F
MPKRTGTMPWTAAAVVAVINFFVCAATDDIVQLGLISAAISALALVAARRNRLTPPAAAITAGFAAQLAIVLTTYDGLFTLWTGAILLALTGATSISTACLVNNHDLNRALLLPATCATAIAESIALIDGNPTITGITPTIAAAPLVAYGMRPTRRPALLLSGFLLTLANTAFVLGTNATTLEWFTLPPRRRHPRHRHLRLPHPIQLDLPRPRPPTSPGPLRFSCQQQHRLPPHHLRSSRRPPDNPDRHPLRPTGPLHHRRHRPPQNRPLAIPPGSPSDPPGSPWPPPA